MGEHMDNNEQTLYGIPLSELNGKGTSYQGGTYYDMNGYCFYVPEEVDDSTPAFIYYPGSGGSGNDAKVIRQLISEKGPDQIIIIADTAYENTTNASTRYSNLISNIGKDNNSNITNISTMGFSAGGPATYAQLVHNVRNNPEGGPYNAIFCDVVNFNTNQEDLELIKQNEGTIMFLEPNGTSITAANNMAKSGVDVVLAWTSGSHAGHVPLNKEALENGLIDYVSGRSTELANADIYKFVVYNSETGNWDQITLEELAAKYEGSVFNSSDPFRNYEKLSTIDVLESSNSFLGDKINNLRAAIRNTNFLSSNIGVDYGSTTNIPGVESDIVQSFFTSSSMLLNLLEKDTAKIIEIGNSIEDMNANLEVQANELNDPNNVVTNNQTTQNNQTTDNVYNNSTVTNPVVNNNINNNNNSSNNNSSTVTTPSVSTPGNSQVVVDSTNAVVATLVTSISKQVLDLEKEVEEKLDKDIKYDNVTTIDKELIDKFLKYDELYTDDNMIVYDGEDGKYKIVIHHEEGKVVGLEYYYDLGDKDTATKAMELMKEDFTDLESIKQDGQYVKLTFKDDLYKDLKLDELKEVYSEFKELKKPEVE